MQTPKSRLPTVAFCGMGRAGKDEAARYLSRISKLRYVGSLSWIAKRIVAESLNICDQEAWETRHERRGDWYRILSEYRRSDPARLVKESLALGEIVVGIRGKEEIEACRDQKLIDHIVWIERPGIPIDPTLTYGRELCDIVLVNDGTLEQFRERIHSWAKEHRLTEENR